MSCLFDALGMAVGVSGAQVRATICDFLEENPIMVDNVRVADLLDDNETPSDLGAYVQAMRSPETWGSALEIDVFTRIWKRNVLVTMPDENVVYFTRSSTPPIQLFWNGGHYELTLPN